MGTMDRYSRPQPTRVGANAGDGVSGWAGIGIWVAKINK